MNANLLTAPAPAAAVAAAPPLPGRFLTAGWRHLLMLNYEVDPALVAPYVPPGLEIDFFQGRTFLSVVGFRFDHTRVFGCALPWHRDFPEVNLRLYVKRQVGDEVRRGVRFIKELVPRRLVAWAARRFYNENFVAVPMRSELVLPDRDQRGRLEYSWWANDRWQRLAATFGGSPRPLTPGSEAEFIAEHYWGYSRQRDGRALEYRVEHPPWRMWSVADWEYDGDVAAVYGLEFVAALAGRPSSVFVAEGSEVVVRRGVRMEHIGVS